MVDAIPGRPTDRARTVSKVGYAGHMGTTSTASSVVAQMTVWPSHSARLGLLILLVATFLAVQAAALAHEFEHVLNQHDAPCGLHVAADHLVIVSAPEPATVPRVPSTAAATLATGHLPPFPARPSSARAPPLLPC
jgi:hypothetical protein